MSYFIGVDVGSGSARAALVTSNGKIITAANHPIKTFHPESGYYEQSSDDIWNSVCFVVQQVSSSVSKESIKGLGFDATCSLVVLDENGLPLTISKTGCRDNNIILWMDHRAEEEANFINDLKHDVLKYVGGKVSLEMEIPKLLWLKRNLKNSWEKAGFFFDLPDFLTWRATGAESRSLCSLVCKWNYISNSTDENYWSKSYLKEIGLSDLADNNWKKIGQEVKSPGEPVGRGLTQKAAEELGLLKNTPVGTSIIDAHAGGLGMLGCQVPALPSNFTNRLALICGTSSCHMAVCKKEVFVQGVWGPYHNAMVPGLWLSEGGQSATGKLIDHVTFNHPASAEIVKNLPSGMHIQEYLNNLLNSMAKTKKLKSVSYLTQDFHVWPDFHGNRSPLADSTLTGMICGLTLSSNEENLAILYLATIQSLTYGTKNILEALNTSGHDIRILLICGGLSQNSLFVQTHADVLNLPIICPNEKESVLLGASILGACAAKEFSSVNKAMLQMGGSGKVVTPNNEDAQFHLKKYKVFKKMVEDQKTYKSYMSDESI